MTAEEEMLVAQILRAEKRRRGRAPAAGKRSFGRGYRISLATGTEVFLTPPDCCFRLKTSAKV